MTSVRLTRESPSNQTAPVTDVGVSEQLRILYPSLRRFAAVIADLDTDPDDLLHDAIVGVLRRQSRQPIDDLGAYVRRAMLLGVMQHRRKTATRRSIAERQRPPRTETDGTEAIFDLLMSIDPIDRALLYAVDVEGTSAADFARMCGRSHAAVRAQLVRARRRAAKLLADPPPSGGER